VTAIKACTGCLRHPRADCGATRRPAADYRAATGDFKSLHLSRSALGSHVAEHFHLRDIRTVKPHAGCLFLAGLRTAGDLLQSSVFAISLHPVFAHVVFAQDLPGLLSKAPVSARLRLVATLRRLRPTRMRALFGRMLPSGQSGRPLFMRRSRPGCRWQDQDRGPPAPD
jgi:hypothetical protein